MIWSNFNHVLLFEYLLDYDSQTDKFNECFHYIVRYRVDINIYSKIILNCYYHITSPCSTYQFWIWIESFRIVRGNCAVKCAKSSSNDLENWYRRNPNSLHASHFLVLHYLNQWCLVYWHVRRLASICYGNSHFCIGAICQCMKVMGSH